MHTWMVDGQDVFKSDGQVRTPIQRRLCAEMVVAQRRSKKQTPALSKFEFERREFGMDREQWLRWE
jgi:hypothetical protein